MAELIIIEAQDREWHARYCEFVRQVFPSADFAGWIAWGEWGPDYRAVAWVEGDRILANVGISRMQLCLNGHSLSSYQWGAVGVLPALRGSGLARRVIEAALDYCKGAPILLYANPDVLGFYTRYGFEARPSHRFVIEQPLQPQGSPALRVDIAEPDSRRALHALAARALPCTRLLGAQGYSHTASWYYANGFAQPLYAFEPDLWISAGICTTQAGSSLRVDDVWTARPVDLAELLPRLLPQPVQRIEFGFSPEQCWSTAHAVQPQPMLDPEAYLFVRDFPDWPDQPCGLPPLART